MKTTWKYKDSKRYYWLVELEKEGEVKEGEDIHFEWGYRVFISASGANKSWNQVDEGVFLGQYDEKPSLINVLSQFTNYITNVAFGMIKYAEK